MPPVSRSHRIRGKNIYSVSFLDFVVSEGSAGFVVATTEEMYSENAK
jgi:hypothetical protein